MAQGNYNEPFFWHRVVNVGWAGGWGILTIDMPANQDITNPHGFFPIVLSVGDTIVPNSYFIDSGTGKLDADNWLWFAEIPPFPPVLSQLYDVITTPARDRWIIDGYIDAPATRDPTQEADFQATTASLNAALGYTFTEDDIDQYLRVDSGTTDPPDNTWTGTGDYPVPQTIFAKLYGSNPGRQFRYWFRYSPTDPVHATRNEVRLTFILNFAGGPPAFETSEPIVNGPDQADEHLPSYDLKFQLDIYRRNVTLTVDSTTITGPEADRIYSEQRLVSYTQVGTVVTIAKTGFV